MNMQPDLSAEALRHNLLDRLFGQVRSLSGPRANGFHPQGEQLFTYCAMTRERLKAITLDHPLIGIVLRGRKEIWLGDVVEPLTPGTIFCLPRGVEMDAVNFPSEAEGIYESLIFEIPDLPDGIATLPHSAHQTQAPSLKLRLTSDLIEAVAHAATAIAGATTREDVKTLRLSEMLTLMRDDPAARHIFTRSLPDELAWRIIARPDHAWTVTEAAALFGLGGSSLRRHLARAGTSFRDIMTASRMEVARRLMAEGMGPGAAAEAVGYASRSHFARQYLAAFGVLPSGRARRNDAA